MGIISQRDRRYLLLEAFVVLFGVLAALFVDQWREDNAEQAAAVAATAQVVNEARQNLNELTDMQTEVRQRLALLRELKDDPPEDAALADLLSRFRGFRTPDLSSAAWERLSRSSLADSVPYDFLQIVFRLHALGEQYQQLNSEINHLIYAELFYQPKKLPIALAIAERLMGQQLSWAHELIPMYESFLEQQPPVTR